MRCAAVLLLGLTVCLVPGCFTPEPMHTSKFLDRFQNYEFVNTADMVQIEVRLIETRLADGYINRELWDAAVDEQVVAFDQRGLLAANGLRVGRVAGAVPPRLQELMTLERCCVNPRLLLLPAGKTKTIHLNSVQPECTFTVTLPGQTRKVELARAQVSLDVTATPADGGKVKLHFTPKVEFGDDVSNFRPARDHSGWIMEVKRQGQSYQELGWDVPLAPNTLLVIGGSLADAATLGHEAFVDRQALPPVQRLLVLRTGRVADEGIDAEIAPCPTGHSVHPPPIPLAQQASEPTARAYHP